ncbi:Protein of unknown function [Bacillus cereus]|nr:Protein of unknown function [Bacillus cereus]
METNETSANQSFVLYEEINHKIISTYLHNGLQ